MSLRLGCQPFGRNVVSRNEVATFGGGCGGGVGVGGRVIAGALNCNSKSSVASVRFIVHPVYIHLNGSLSMCHSNHSLCCRRHETQSSGDDNDDNDDIIIAVSAPYQRQNRNPSAKWCTLECTCGKLRRYRNNAGIGRDRNCGQFDEDIIQ